MATWTSVKSQEYVEYRGFHGWSPDLHGYQKKKKEILTSAQENFGTSISNGRVGMQIKFADCLVKRLET